MKPGFSVTPLYNKWARISTARCRPLLGQGFTDFEAIIRRRLDDGPARVAACTDPRITLVRWRTRAPVPRAMPASPWPRASMPPFSTPMTNGRPIFSRNLPR